MLKIKLIPFGKKHRRVFRVAVVADREKLTSNPTAVLGTYDKLTKKLDVDSAQLKAWVAKGAQVTASLRAILPV